MAVSPEAVLKDLKAKKFAPIYFLQGDEPYFIDLITDFIEKNAIPEFERGFNQLVLYGKDSSISTILNNARKFPMMAERQLVVVKEAQSIPDWGKEEAQKLLISYLTNPLPSTILVFAYKLKKLDGRSSLKKELEKKSVFVESEKVKDWKLTEWVDGYFRELGHQIEPKAAQLLADSIGNNLEVITNDFNTLPQLIVGTQRIATMHRRLAELYAEHLPLRLLPAPVKLPVMREHMLWHRSMDGDPMHRWLRERISEFIQHLERDPIAARDTSHPESRLAK